MHCIVVVAVYVYVYRVNSRNMKHMERQDLKKHTTHSAAHHWPASLSLSLSCSLSLARARTLSCSTSSNWRGVARWCRLIVRLEREKFPLPPPINTNQRTPGRHEVEAQGAARGHADGRGASTPVFGYKPRRLRCARYQAANSTKRINFPVVLYAGAFYAFAPTGAWKNKLKEGGGKKGQHTHGEARLLRVFLLSAPRESPFSASRMSERGGLPRTGGVPSPHMQPSKPVSITSNRPVHMNLYATWEVDRSSPSCVPRYVKGAPAKKRVHDLSFCGWLWLGSDPIAVFTMGDFWTNTHGRLWKEYDLMWEDWCC